MNTFELYEKLITKTQILKTQCEDTCDHKNTIIENSITMCLDCGVEIKYPENTPDTKLVADTSRYYIRKNNIKSIYEDIKHLDISDHIKDIANEIYIEVCGYSVHRGIHRKSIIFASVFHAFKMDDNPVSYEYVRKMFNSKQITLKRKDALKGLKFVNENAPKNSPLRTLYITPEHLIREFMKKFKASKSQTEEVVSIYNSVKGKSSILNRSRPQSVAAGIIYYYTNSRNKEIPMKEFTQKVNLSELTINKINKEVVEIIENDKN